MADTPTMGDEAVVNALNPAPADVPDTPRSAPDMSDQAMDPMGNDATPVPPTPTSGKPSLWRGVLAGALQGLAAGAATPTRGMGNGGAFAAGAGAGVNQVLNNVPQQQAQLDQAKVTTAIHYANLSKMMRDIHTAPATRQEQILSDAADDTGAMLKSGTVVPLSDPSDDPIDAQKKIQELHAANPWAVYMPLPIKGAKGIQYTAVQFTKAPTQSDLTFKGKDGNDLTIPAGTPGDQAGKLYSTWKSKQIEAQNKQSLSDSKAADRSALQTQKDNAAVSRQQSKLNADGTKPTKAPDMAFGTDPDSGLQVADTPDNLNAMGIKDSVKVPGIEVPKILVARQLVGPRKGLFDLVWKDIDDLSKKGKLGLVGARWNDFVANKIGNDPDLAPLHAHMPLLSTALAQAHVGNRATDQTREHFENLANHKIDDEATLRAAVNAEWQYVNEKAMLGKKNPNFGRTGPGQPFNASGSTAPTSSAPLKGVQKSTGKPVISNDGGKTWQLAQ